MLIDDRIGVRFREQGPSARKIDTESRAGNRRGLLLSSEGHRRPQAVAACGRGSTKPASASASSKNFTTRPDHRNARWPPSYQRIFGSPQWRHKRAAWPGVDMRSPKPAYTKMRSGGTRDDHDSGETTR